MAMVLCGVYTAAAAPARAQEPQLDLRIEGDLPFRADQLTDALRLRLHDRELAPTVTVIGDGDVVRVRMAGKERVVALEGTSGLAAARRVALAVVDLAELEATPPQLAPVPARAPAAAPAPARTDAEAAASAETPSLRVTGSVRAPRPPRLALAMYPAVQVDAHGGAVPGAALEASLALGGAWCATVQVGWQAGPDATAGGERVAMTELPVRAGVGQRRGALAWRATAIALPYRVSGGRGHTGMELGAGASLALFVPVGAVTLVVAAGADGFAGRTRFQIHGEDAVATPRLAGWIGAGVAWEWRR